MVISLKTLLHGPNFMIFFFDDNLKLFNNTKSAFLPLIHLALNRGKEKNNHKNALKNENGENKKP